MQARDATRKAPVTAAPDTSISEVAALMDDEWQARRPRPRTPPQHAA